MTCPRCGEEQIEEALEGDSEDEWVIYYCPSCNYHWDDEDE